MDTGGNSLASGPDGVKRKVCYFYDPEVGNYYYGQGHPMKPHRIRMTHALLAHYGLLQHMQVLKPFPARDRDLCRFHADDFVSFLRSITPETQQDQIRQLKQRHQKQGNFSSVFPINRYAFSGGQDSIEKHREIGADLEVDIPVKYLSFFLEDDAELEQIKKEYGEGRMLTGEVKKRLTEVLTEMVERHRMARAAVTDEMVDAFMAVRPLPNTFE